MNLTTCHNVRLDPSHPFGDVSEEKEGELLVEEMKKFWELESIGVLANEASVHDMFVDTIHKRDSRYQKYLYRGRNITLCYQTTMKLQSHA